ncbi:MAG TPA: magnesium transporter CorA family protein [Promineifilum sp.]|nr:magnesium transporter CorA family protein [Promineifilum sp.]
MISVYQENDGWLEQTSGYEKGTWIHAENPDEEEINHLHEVLGVPLTFLRAALDPREVARTDSRKNIHLIIVRVPYEFGAGDRVPYRTVPMAMIVAPDHFITLCHRRIDFVRDLNYSYDERELGTRRAARLVLAILGVVGDWFLRYLEEIDRRLEDVEERLMDSIENKEMMELLSYEKSLVYIKTGLQWNNQMLEHLQGKASFGWDAEDQELFEDVQIEYRQGYHMAETMLEVLEGTTDAFASLISNNLNVVMKFLAAITIVMTVPTLIASIYGMNVTIPGEDAPYMFVMLMLGSALLALLVAGWFYRHGWLSFRLKRYD